MTSPASPAQPWTSPDDLIDALETHSPDESAYLSELRSIQTLLDDLGSTDPNAPLLDRVAAVAVKAPTDA